MLSCRTFYPDGIHTPAPCWASDLDEYWGKIQNLKKWCWKMKSRQIFLKNVFKSIQERILYLIWNQLVTHNSKKLYFLSWLNLSIKISEFNLSIEIAVETFIYSKIRVLIPNILKELKLDIVTWLQHGKTIWAHPW